MKFVMVSACLLLTAANVLAATCTPSTPPGHICTPPEDPETAALKVGIKANLDLAQGIDERLQIAKAAYMAVRGKPPTEESLAACKAYLDLQKAQDSRIQAALDLTADLYHVHARNGGTLTVAEPDDRSLSWLTGTSATWSYQATNSGPGVRFAFRLKSNQKDADGHDIYRYGGLLDLDPFKVDKDGNVIGRGAFTLPDGRTYVLKGFLYENADHPEIIASTLYHERKHFEDLNQRNPQKPGTSRGWSTQEKEEVIAYTAQLNTATIFGLDRITVGALTFQLNNFASATGSTPFFDLTQKQEAAWQDVYDHEQVADLETEYEALKASVRQAREAQEREQADRERRDREVAQASSRATLAALTNQCGFQPVFGPPSADVFWSEAKPGDVIKGYVNQYAPLDAYTFPTAQTWDDLKVTLMLTRSCSIVDPNVHGTNETVAPPCNKGVDILNAHAHDQAFLDRITAQVTMKDGTGFGSPNRHYVYGCVSDILKQFRFPLTVKKYQKAFEAQAERNARIRKEKEKAQERESEEGDRSERRTPRERPQRPYDPCRDNGNIRCP